MSRLFIQSNLKFKTCTDFVLIIIPGEELHLGHQLFIEDDLKSNLLLL